VLLHVIYEQLAADVRLPHRDRQSPMPSCGTAAEARIAIPHWAEIHRDLKRKHVTLTMLWNGGQLNPTLASRFKINRTVDGATPTRRAISFSPTPAVVKRSTSRTWRIVVLSAGIRSPVQKPKERTLIGPAEAPLNRARSSRNGGRNHLGTSSEIKSECWARSSRIREQLPPESALPPKPLAPAVDKRIVAVQLVPDLRPCMARFQQQYKPRSPSIVRPTASLVAR
jgi:hypothetical protein